MKTARILALAVTLGSAALGAQQQTPPRFTSSVDVTIVDVAVVGDNGQPIPNLQPSDFTVRVDNDVRKVVSAEWVPLVAADANTGKVAPPPPEGYSSNENMANGRLIVLAIDQPNIRPGGTQAMQTAVNTFFDKLLPSDRVAVVGFGTGAAPTPFLSDRDRLKRAVALLVGEKRSNLFTATTHNISATEALAMARGDIVVHDLVISRECMTPVRRTGFALAMCRQEVEMEAAEVAQEGTRGADQTIRALGDLLTSMRVIEGPKTLLVVSEGFLTTEATLSVAQLGALAAASRTTLYALLIGNAGDAADNRSIVTQASDQRDQRGGLELLAQVSRGTMFTINGTGASVFERIQSELSGYYLIGLESNPKDRDGKQHPIRIDVSRRGAIVRARRQALDLSLDQTPPRSPRQAVTAAITSPLLASALPMRVATFPLEGLEPGRVQILIHADVGVDFTTSLSVAVGYVISDAAGRNVASDVVTERLAPVMNGVPSSLQFRAGASVPPGDYTLKIVAFDGDRTGSVEHPLHAALVEAGNVRFSDLMAGGPTDNAVHLSPTVGYTVSYGVLHGYLEAYGPLAEAVTVRYEIAKDASSAALLSADVPGRLIGDDRMIFTHNMSVNQLPPGQYVLRAKASVATKPVRTFTRGFELAAPAVLLASAEGTGTAPDDSGLFLPVDEAAFARPFQREDVLAPTVLDEFRVRLAETVKADFDAGIASLQAGDYAKAEASFKRAIQPDVDSSTSLAYLAATFAASGRDSDAASAWQTALADGAEQSHVYEWLSQALLRSHNLQEAQSILTEAIGKWPSDPRFTGPAAAMDAIFGNGRQAMFLLERYLTARPDDLNALRIAVEWIYQAHLASRVIHTQTEDMKLAHGYADAYAKANGPDTPIVQQWIEFLDREHR